MLGGAPGDYELGNESVVSKADASKSISYAQAAQKAIELGGKYSARTSPKDINPVTKIGVNMIAGTGLIGCRQGQPAAGRRHPGLTVTFAEIELDSRPARSRSSTCCASPIAARCCIRRAWRTRFAGGNVMGIGMAMLERHVYDPKLGLPTTHRYQSKPADLLDVPPEIGWGAVEKPDPQNPSA